MDQFHIKGKKKKLSEAIFSYILPLRSTVYTDIPSERAKKERDRENEILRSKVLMFMAKT